MSKTNATISALRKFTREGEISLDEAWEFITAILGSDDRTVAIMAATLIEKILHGLLSAHMRPMNSTERERLFGDMKPLSGFSAKIWVAWAFNLIDDSTAKRLDLVREIRNAFAHSLRPVSFSTPEVDAATKLFGLPANVDLLKEARTNGAEARSRFQAAFTHLTEILTNEWIRVHARRTPPSSPQTP